MMFPLFEAMERSTVGMAIMNSTWMFATIEIVHLLALVLLGGAALVVDLRLLGFGLRRLPVAELARHVRPWLNWGLVGMIATGVPLLMSLAASKYYGHPFFWWKMYFLLAAIVFTYTIRQAVIAGGEERANSVLGKLVAILSIFLWSSVGIAGKGIGYY
jgi:hypothetical protein